MKKSTKAVLTALCAVLLVAGSIFGTMAYLTDQKSVTNTFTVGDVKIELKEYDVDLYGSLENSTESWTTEGNEYKLIPGHDYIKNPTVFVKAGSEKCYVFAEVENDFASGVTVNINTTAWTQIEGTNIYYYNDPVTAGKDSDYQVTSLFTTLTVASDTDVADFADESGEVDETVTVTAYAVQADGFDTALLAWGETYGKEESTDSE